MMHHATRSDQFVLALDQRIDESADITGLGREPVDEFIVQFGLVMSS